MDRVRAGPPERAGRPTPRTSSGATRASAEARDTLVCPCHSEPSLFCRKGHEVKRHGNGGKAPVARQPPPLPSGKRPFSPEGTAGEATRANGRGSRAPGGS